MTIFALALVCAPTKAHVKAPISINVAKVVTALRPIAFAPAPTGSKILASMEDGSVRVIDCKTRETVRPLNRHPQPAYGLAWSPGGQLVATGDETARIWIENALTGQKIREYRTHKRGIQKLSFNEFGNLLISTGQDDQVNVYNLQDPNPKEELEILGKGMNFYGATFNPQSSRFFTVAMLDGGMREYDCMTGHVNKFFSDPNGQGMFDVTYSPSGGREVSAGRDGKAIVWDSKTSKRLGTLQGHQDWVIKTAISPNGRLIATSSTDRTVKVWDMYTMTKVADLPNEMAVGSPLCFTADGATLVTVNVDGNLQFNSVNPPQAAVKPLVQVAVRKSKHRHS